MSTSKSPSEEVFLRFIQERFSEFRQRFADLIVVLAANNQEAKLTRATDAWDSAKSLQKSLAKTDQPQWLAPLTQTLMNYVVSHGDSDQGRLLLLSIRDYGAMANNHTWEFIKAGDTPFDFDDLYRRYEDESKIPELFDNLVGLLQQILDSNEIDSRKVVGELETIIATLKRNRKGSYFGVAGTWRFAGTYLKNVAWNVLGEIPVLKSFTNALHDTMKELDDEMARVNEAVQSELSERFHAEFPELIYQRLPPPEPLRLTDESVADAEFEVIPAQEKQPPAK